ncbi:uncharacterized protein VP01_4973g1, partial [Puccinia sorghi]
LSACTMSSAAATSETCSYRLAYISSTLKISHPSSSKVYLCALSSQNPSKTLGWSLYKLQTKNKAEDCIQAKLKPPNLGLEAKAAVDQSSDVASIKSISTSSGFLATRQVRGMVAIRQALEAKMSGKGEPCFLDSGASHHMFADQAFFSHYCPQKNIISLADGNFLASSSKGYMYIKYQMGNPVKLKALHVPKLAGTLISLGRLYKSNCDIVCTGKDSFDLVSNGAPVLSGVINNGTFSA